MANKPKQNKKIQNCRLNDSKDLFSVWFFTLCFINSLTINGLFSWVWHQMSQRLSVDFDGSISLPTAIPRAFICLSLTTVCLTDRLTAHSHSGASAQPCSSHRKNPPHIPDSVTTTISGGGFASETFSPTPASHSFSVWATCVEGRRICKHAPLTYCSLLLLGVPQAHSCPELDSNIYEQFVILLRKLGRFHAPGARGEHGHAFIICGIFMTLICAYHVVNMFVSSLICSSKFVHNFISCLLLPWSTYRQHWTNLKPLTLLSLTHTSACTQSFSLLLEVLI